MDDFFSRLNDTKSPDIDSNSNSIDNDDDIFNFQQENDDPFKSLTVNDDNILNVKITSNGLLDDIWGKQTQSNKQNLEFPDFFKSKKNENASINKRKHESTSKPINKKK
eukprot:189480_1